MIVVFRGFSYWKEITRYWEEAGHWLLRQPGDSDWVYLDQPDVGSIVVVLIGATFGALSARIVSDVFTRSGNLYRAFCAAVCILVISVGYSLPLYHKEISGLLHDSGLSTLKISVAELSVEASLAGKGTQGSDSASGKATGSPSLSIARTTDPTPGVEALAVDFGPGDDNRFAEDIAYIKLLDTANKESLERSISDTRRLLKPVEALASCLRIYNSSIKDSQLLLIDIKPAISALFTMHRKLVDDFRTGTTKPSDPLTMNNEDHAAHAAFEDAVNLTIGSILKTIPDPKNSKEQCFYYRTNRKDYNDTDKQSGVKQPYSVLALVDLLIAHGASDEAQGCATLSS
jgi:hypothetical protein